MTSTRTIEELWQALRRRGTVSLQQRVDATHPCDLYVDFEPPSRPGLVAICSTRPPSVRPMRAVAVDEGQRADGRWSLRLSLNEATLFPVFAALCYDVVEFTRAGVQDGQLGAAVVQRVEHWRNLLERDSAGLGDTDLRGLIGELAVLEKLLDTMPAMDAVGSWTGPLRTPQDFTLPTGRRLEVKAARPNAANVHINGLSQLDPSGDELQLLVVRIEETGTLAPDSVTASALIDRIALRLINEPDVLNSFHGSLALMGWHEHPSHDALAVRLMRIDSYDVGADFPKLTMSTVPAGVEEAEYTIALPEGMRPFRGVSHE